MFQWLKKFLAWPPGGIKDIKELGKYIKNNWLELIIFIIVVIVVIWVVIKILKMIISLTKNN
jgi:hypothetical protein